jgi:hypothetical protein
MEFVEQFVEPALKREEGRLTGHVVEFRAIHPVFEATEKRFVIGKLVVDSDRDLSRSARAHNRDGVLGRTLHECVQVFGDSKINLSTRGRHSVGNSDNVDFCCLRY